MRKTEQLMLREEREASDRSEASDRRLHTQTPSMTRLGWLGSLDGPFLVKGEELRALASPEGDGRSDVVTRVRWKGLPEARLGTVTHDGPS